MGVVVVLNISHSFFSLLNFFYVLGNENRFKTEEECLAKCGDNNQTNKIIHEDE
jgi:hypothetical protein